MRKLILLLVFALTIVGQGYAQQPLTPEPVAISEIQVYDMGNGQGLLEVRVSGPGARTIPGGSFTITENAQFGFTASGTMVRDRPLNLPGSEEVILHGGFLYRASTSTNGNGNGNGQPTLVDIFVRLQGSSLTKSKVNSSFKVFEY